MGRQTGPNGKVERPEIKTFKRKEVIEGWSDTWGELSGVIREIATEIGLNGTKFRSSENKENLREIIRKNHSGLIKVSAPDWNSDGVSIPAALNQAIPRSQLIPAVRDAVKEGRSASGTCFSMLVKEIVLPAIMSSPEYKSLNEAACSLRKLLRGENGDGLREVKSMVDSLTNNIQRVFPASVIIGLDTPDAEKFVGASTTIGLDDGVETSIEYQGHGVQRALVFSMLEYLASRERSEIDGEGQKNVRSKVLLFEEPELFIHPHLMRILKSSLEELAKNGSWQVIVTTHSPFLIDVGNDPKSLAIFQKIEDGSRKKSTIRQLFEDPLGDDDRERLRATLDFHPTVCEAFFAERTVLVEGDTELAVLIQNRIIHPACDIDYTLVRNTSVVSCKGKWTIIPIAKLLKSFRIPFKVIHDEDRKDYSDSELMSINSHPFHANKKILEVAGHENVYLVKDTFEDVLWGDQARAAKGKDKPYRAWKRLHELCRDDMKLDDSSELKKIVKFAFEKN